MSKLETLKSNIPQLFDRQLYRQRRQQLTDNSIYFKLTSEISTRLQLRLSILQHNFQTVLQVGSDQNLLQRYLKSHKKTELFIQEGETLNFDEEALPFSANSFDLILHLLNLNAVNDVPGVLAQTLQCLKPDGLLLAAFVGENSFYELRTILEEVELEHYQGISQRISPWIRTRDAGSLLQRAGFSLPVADCDRLEIFYPTLKMLWQDLKQAKATSYLMNRQAPALTRSLLSKVESIYKGRFWDHAQRGFKVSLDIVYMAGWRPAPHQQEALSPGSAKHQLTDFL